MKSLEFSNHLHWARVFWRAMLSLLVLLGCVIVIAVLRQTCHLGSMLICAFVLIALNIYSFGLSSKNRYEITDELLLVKEHFPFRKRITLSIPISMIDQCELTGFFPYHRVRLVVHGHPYLLRNVSAAKDLVKQINDKKEA